VYVDDLAEKSPTPRTSSEVGGLDQDRFVDAKLINFPTSDVDMIPVKAIIPVRV
jgi:hypothetical protein